MHLIHIDDLIWINVLNGQSCCIEVVLYHRAQLIGCPFVDLCGVRWTICFDAVPLCLVANVPE